MTGASSTTITMSRYAEILNRARSWQHASWVLTAATGIGALATGYLWYRASRTPALEVSAGSGGATVSLVGQF